MILEIAILNIVPGATARFEKAFAEAQEILAAMPGYLGHELRPCVEDKNCYLLQVQWASLEDHVEGFRKSPQYARWRELLHHFYDPFPEVSHYHPPVCSGTALAEQADG